MKPKLLFIVLFFLVVDASAQKSYLSAGIGYGFYIPDDASGGLRAYTDYDAEGTLGKGMTYGFNIGHMVNETAGIDLGIWYVAGSTFESYSFDSTHFAVPVRIRGNTLRIMPSLKLAFGNRYVPYIKLGYLLGIATTVDVEDEYDVGNICVISPYIVTHKFSGGSSSGFFLTLGIDLMENEKISFFVEANLVSQNYEPVKETIDACYATTITYQLVDKPNPNNPDEKQKPSFPFSTIGFNAGVKFLLGAKNKAAAPAAKDAPQTPQVK